MIVFERNEWSAHEPKGGPVPVKLGLVIVHHFWRPHVPAGTELSKEIAMLEGVERFHIEDRGWGDIGYNWLITQNGHIYEGRGWGRAGAHTKGQNNKSVGVCFSINGDEHALTPAAVEACRELLAEGVLLGHIVEGFDIKGHCDYADKSCPGTKVRPFLGTLRPVFNDRRSSDSAS